MMFKFSKKKKKNFFFVFQDYIENLKNLYKLSIK